MKKKITVIGSSNVDMIIKLKQLPKPGETIAGGVFTQVLGGKGANQAVAAARAAGPSINVSFVTCLGNDTYSEYMIQSFRNDNLDVNSVFKETGASTGTAFIIVDDSGTNSIAVASGANYLLSPKHIDLALNEILDAEFVILQMEIPIETIKYVIEIANKYRRKVILNVAPAVQIENDYLNKIDIIIVNETEASLLSGIKVDTDNSIEKAAKILRKKGVNTVIITLGANGSYIDHNKINKFIPGFKVEAVDTTAAGDTYCGTLAVALSEDKNIMDAILFASAASAISVTRLGAQPSIPSRKAIDEFLQKYSRCI